MPRDIYNYNPPPESESGNSSDSWPFSVPYEHQFRFEEWLRAYPKSIVILGPPQVVKSPGIRLLGPIVELATTLEIMRASQLPLPEPLILAPIYINSWANSGDPARNSVAAEMFANLAQRYFAVFHPELPTPVLQTDQPQGIDQIAGLAQRLWQQVSLDGQQTLSTMALKHHQNHSDENSTRPEERTTAYLLAHYAVYGGLDLPDYYPSPPNPLFLVPQAEATFRRLMGQEVNRLLDDRGYLSDPAIMTYSDTVTAPHYYPHRGEPSIAQATNQWPTRNIISRLGANGWAQAEIWKVVQMIEENIGGRNNVRKLQQEVLSPVYLTYI